MDNPLVSIVMRTKDREILLERAIKDCANQSYPHFELIIVNDGGKPTGVDGLLKKYENQLAGRARVIHNPKSLGMEAASNKAIESSNGKYICIHDDDDTWSEKFLDTCVQYLESHPSDGGVAVRTEIIYEKLNQNSVTEIRREIAWSHITQFSLSRLMESNIAVPISCMYRRDVIDNLGRFRSDLPVVGDWEFHIRLAASYDVGFIDGKPLAFWHQRPAAKGTLGNSVIAGEDQHAYFELQVRDEYLREFVKQHGVGALLWQASMFNDLRWRNETAFHWIKERVKHFLKFRHQK